MIKLVFYNNTKTYVYQTSHMATPERVAEEYPIVNLPDLKCVIGTDKTETMFYTVPEPLLVMASRLGVNPEDYTTDEELLQALEDISNAPQPEPEPSAEERIAAAMEYQSMMM